jgi:hypothetical protein
MIDEDDYDRDVIVEVAADSSIELLNITVPHFPLTGSFF